MESQSILVLGATGGSGLAFVEEALNIPTPPHLVLYVRTPSKVPAHITSHSKVTVVAGSLNDEDVLSSAMKANSVTAVISFLGAYISLTSVITRPTDTPIGNSFPGIIQAMRANGVRRLMALSTPSYWVNDKDSSTWKLSAYNIVPKIFAPQGNAEMVKIAQEVAKANDLDWTIYRIPHLTDGSGGLPVYAGYAGPSHKGGLELSRRSLARWVLDELQEPRWIQEAPFLGN